MQLKVLSWNIWIKGYFDQVTDFLKTASADIIGLQEVVGIDSQRDIIGFLKSLGYQHVFAPVEHGWAGKIYKDGPAVFTKFKIKNTETYMLSGDEPRSAVRAEVAVGDKTLHVFSTHLVHTHQKQLDVQDEQARTLISKLPKDNTILMGDFNASPESFAIKNIEKMLVNVDSTNAPTWSVYPAGCKVCNPQEINTRLDYIFTSRNLKTSGYKVNMSKASDHLPISVTVEI